MLRFGQACVLVEVSVDADHFITWKKPEARTVTVSGLTIGANFKF